MARITRPDIFLGTPSTGPILNKQAAIIHRELPTLITSVKKSLLIRRAGGGGGVYAIGRRSRKYRIGIACTTPRGGSSNRTILGGQTGLDNTHESRHRDCYVV